MRESTFIDRNKDRWHQIETREAASPDETASNFIDLTSDLSYAQSRYPHSYLTKYLNQLAVRQFKKIYATPSQNQFLAFFSHKFPSVLGHHRRVLWLSTVYFLICVALGALCTVLEPAFIDATLGSDYVQKTLENIRAGKPFGIYNQDTSLEMFLQIFSNNFAVGLTMYAAGIFLGLGTFYHVFKNGLMVGVFFTLFFKHKLGWQALSVILLHGTIELTTIILECTAGLILGLSFVLPGTLTRWQAFKKGLLESSVIYLGTVPLTFVAAVIESYVTRLGQNGLSFNQPLLAGFLLLVLAGSWVFVIQYIYRYSYRLGTQTDSEVYLREFI